MPDMHSQRQLSTEHSELKPHILPVYLVERLELHPDVPARATRFVSYNCISRARSDHVTEGCNVSSRALPSPVKQHPSMPPCRMGIGIDQLALPHGMRNSGQ